jgi:uncharacterized phage-associated protein
MLINRNREKLINAIVFFARNTNYCGKTKLFKLLYLLDFSHFRETGLSVTGMDYRAWKMGPVPFTLFQEWDVLDADLKDAVDIVPTNVHDYDREEVHPKVEFDADRFTKRELRIMQALADQFRDAYAIPLVELTDHEGGAWHKTWDAGRGDDQRIPYALAAADTDEHREAVLATADEYAGFRSTPAARTRRA